ncbi:MAG: hypothetical protein ACYC5G_05370 [Candidatus Doudnabacteria bacterium]
MAKEKISAVSDQQSAISEQPITEELVVQGNTELVEQKKPAGVLIGFEAFASAKELHWTAKVRLELYAEQNKVTEKTFDEWEKILVQL